MIQALIIVFGFIGLGYVTQRKDESNRSLAKLCLYFLIPILIFQSFLHTSVSLKSLGIIVLHFFITTLAVYFLTAGILGKIIGWRGEALKWNSLAATLANVGYFGLAFIRFGLGEAAVPYAVAVSLAFNVYMAVFGFTQISNEKNWSGRLRRVIQNPYLYAVIAGLFWSWLGIGLPLAIDSFLKLASDATLPLTLLLTGAELSRSRIVMTGLWEALQISVVKLIVPLVVAWPLAWFMMDDPLARNVMTLMFGMPTSINLMLLAKDIERDTAGLAAAIMLTTILSPITLAAFMELFR